MGEKAKILENNRLLNQGPNKRLFKINSGMGWCGKVVKRTPQSITLSNPRPLHAAPAGWPDLTGFESIVVTQDMVGQKIAVFVGEEIKAGKDRMSPKQTKFQKLILSFGGIFRIIRG